MRRSHMLAVICVFVTSLLLTNHSFATKMLHRNAEELASLANRVFVGVCKSVEQRQNGSLYYTEYTFEVQDGIKGVNTGTVLVFRQFATPPGAGRIAGFPSYQSGGKYLLFLRADSELGLTSPIGLTQGAFQIFRSNDGSEKAINGLDNKGLFRGMDKSSGYSSLSVSERSLMEATSGSVNLNSLVGLVRKMAR